MPFPRRTFLIGALGSSIARADSTKPKQILIIRHAEKPPGKQDSHLTPRGYERAAALPRLFPSRFDTPEFLFASAPSRHSNRPIETVTPLAKVFRLKMNTRFGEDDVRSLANELLKKRDYAGKTVLVCWHHEQIPHLAAALGVAAPPKWHDTVFDRVWKVAWPGDAARLTDLPQHLLQGDS